MLLELHLSDLRSFFKANGQDFGAMKLFTSEIPEPVDEEDFESSLLRNSKAKTLVDQQKVSWSDLKNTALVLESVKYKNPWAHRLEYGGKEAKLWQEALRRKSEFSTANSFLHLSLHLFHFFLCLQ